jgi:hypothetical protein
MSDAFFQSYVTSCLLGYRAENTTSFSVLNHVLISEFYGDGIVEAAHFLFTPQRSVQSILMIFYFFTECMEREV